MTDRLYIEKHVGEKIIPVIDQRKFPDLGQPTSHM